MGDPASWLYLVLVDEEHLAAEAAFFALWICMHRMDGFMIRYSR